jgi:hypothetical protein
MYSGTEVSLIILHQEEAHVVRIFFNTHLRRPKRVGVMIGRHWLQSANVQPSRISQQK